MTPDRLETRTLEYFTGTRALKIKNAILMLAFLFQLVQTKPEVSTLQPKIIVGM